MVTTLRGAGRQAAAEQPRRLLALGLVPYPEGWRAYGSYAAHTKVLLADPRTALAPHPMVPHRGGFPDGA